MFLQNSVQSMTRPCIDTKSQAGPDKKFSHPRDRFLAHLSIYGWGHAGHQTHALLRLFGVRESPRLLTWLSRGPTEIDGDPLRHGVRLHDHLPRARRVLSVAGPDEPRLRVAHLLLAIRVRLPAPAAVLRTHRGSKVQGDNFLQYIVHFITQLICEE